MKFSCIYDYRLLFSYVFSNSEFIAFLSQLANLTQRESVFDVRRREFWKVPHFRTNYALQSLAHNLPTLLNNIIMNRIDIHCITKKTLRTFLCC